MSPLLPQDTCVVFDIFQTTPAPVQQGDVVVFRHPVHKDTVWVSRVIGMPGDIVQTRAGRLILNDVPVATEDQGIDSISMQASDQGIFPRCSNKASIGEECERTRLTETLPNGASYDILDIQEEGVLDDTKVFSVPDGHLFMLGDHRDNANDSRVPQRLGGLGFVPVVNVFGSLAYIKE